MSQIKLRYYIIIILVALALCFISPIFSFGKFIYSIFISNDGDWPRVSNTGVFECGDNKFGLDVPVSRFALVETNSAGYVKKCEWRSDNYYIISLSNINDPHDFSVEDYIQGREDLGLLETRYRLDGVETRSYHEFTKNYSLGRFIVEGKRAYVLNFVNEKDINLDNPEFRSFVDSFNPLN